MELETNPTARTSLCPLGQGKYLVSTGSPLYLWKDGQFTELMRGCYNYRLRRMSNLNEMEKGRRSLMMDQILTIRLYAAGIGIVVGEFLGSFDDLLYALVVFVATDYVDGDLSHRISRHEDRQLAFLTQQKAKDPLPQGDVPTSDNAIVH